MQAGGREFESLYLHLVLVNDSMVKTGSKKYLTKTDLPFIIEWLTKTESQIRKSDRNVRISIVP